MPDLADPTSEPEVLLGAARLAFYTPIRHYPTLADCKAGAILAADGLMISVLLIFRDPLDNIIQSRHGEGLAQIYLVLTLLASFASLFLIGGYCAYRSLTLPIPPMPHSLANYNDIAALDLDAYRRRISSHTFRQVVHAILDYNYSVATLCSRKFALVARSTACVRAEFILWITLLLVIAMMR